jgi:hypothetical protein
MSVPLTPEIEALLALSAARQMESLVFDASEATVFLARGAELCLAPAVHPGDALDPRSGWRLTLTLALPAVPHDGDHLAINLASTFWEVAGLLLRDGDEYAAVQGNS